MRLCVTQFSPTGFSASKGFQRNLIFCSNEATACVFSALLIKSKKKTSEENHRKKSGQKGPLNVIQSLFCSEQRKDCKELPFEPREHNDLDETGPETVPSTWHTALPTAPGAQSAPAALHWDRLPVPAHPLWLESVFPACRKINAILLAFNTLQKCFPK